MSGYQPFEVLGQMLRPSAANKGKKHWGVGFWAIGLFTQAGPLLFTVAAA
jgi:hypothetical protein